MARASREATVSVRDRLHGNGLVVVLLTLGCALTAVVSGEAEFYQLVGTSGYSNTEPVPSYRNDIRALPGEVLYGGFSRGALLNEPLWRPLTQQIYNSSMVLSSHPVSNLGVAAPTAPLSLLQSFPAKLGLTYNSDKVKVNKVGRVSWGYSDSDRDSLGPTQWYQKFPACSTRFQSPIDIRRGNVRFTGLPAIRLYSVDGRSDIPIGIVNLGATVSLKPKTMNIIFEGGNLPGKFVLYNVHFHWGNRDIAGSEHRLEGRAFPLEMHIVTHNTKYRDMMEAAGMDDGIHVIAVVFERSRRANSGLTFCLRKFRKVRTPGFEVDGGVFNVKRLLPRPYVPYFRYHGSLTTPPCTDKVIWSVYSQPLIISGQQLAQFRLMGLNTVANPFFGGNSRPVQPINNRVVMTNNPFYT